MGTKHQAPSTKHQPQQPRATTNNQQHHTCSTETTRYSWSFRTNTTMLTPLHASPGDNNITHAAPKPRDIAGASAQTPLCSHRCMQRCEHSGVCAEAPAISRGFGAACVMLLSPGDACNGVSIVVFVRKLQLYRVVSVLHVWCCWLLVVALGCCGWCLVLGAWCLVPM